MGFFWEKSEKNIKRNNNESRVKKSRDAQQYKQQKTEPDDKQVQPTLIDDCQLEPELQKYLDYPRPVIEIKHDGLPFFSIGEVPVYEGFSQSVIGQRHINEGTEKEDNCFVQKDEENGVWAFALGDGHGDPNCARSKIGSELVSKIAVEKLLELEAGVRKDGTTKLFLKEKWRKPLMQQLTLSIKAAWDDAVLQDLKDNPLTDEELARCDSYRDAYSAGESLEHIYGTTLIAGLSTRDYLLLIQQGDGRCDVFHADGSVDQPIPWDDDCIGNATTSMCQPDAWKRCRYCVIDLHKDPVIACFAGSDGVEDSFRTMEDVHTYYRSKLMYAFDNGISELVSHLETALTDLNRAGSMDDTTVVGIINMGARENRSLYKRYQQENEAHRLLTVWNSANEVLQSKSGRLGFLAQKCSDARQRFELLKKNEAAILKFRYAEQFCEKLGQLELASQGITTDEYRAANSILQDWLIAHEQLRGKWDEYIRVGEELDKWEADYRDYNSKYIQIQREKAEAARDLEKILTNAPGEGSLNDY